MRNEYIFLGIIFLLICLMSSRCFAEEEKGVVSYWKFDEGSGEVVKDSSGNNYHGKINGATWVKDKYGSALMFDGINDYVDCGSEITLNLTSNDITVEAWVKPNKLTNFAPIFTTSFGASTGKGKYMGWYFGFIESKLLFCMADASGKGSSAKSDVAITKWLPIDVWQHMAMTKSGTEVRFYRNGVKIGTTTLPSAEIQHSTLSSFIGLNANNAAYFDGLIAEVRIYSRALSQEEISEHSQSSKRIGENQIQKEPAQAAYWKFDESSGKVVIDSSENNNHGEIYGATWVKDEYGSALMFDGIDNYVDCGKSPSLDITDAITIEAWVFVRAMPTPGTQPAIVFKSFNSYGLTYYSNGECHFYIARNSGNEPRGTTIFPDAWHHVVGTFDGKMVNLYVDGNLVLSDVSKVSAIPVDNSENLLIGGRTSGRAAPAYFNGAIAGVRIYRCALSEKEIKEHYQSSRPKIKASSLILKEGSFKITDIQGGIDEKGIYLFTQDSFVGRADGVMEKEVTIPDGEYIFWARMLDAPDSKKFLSNVVVNGVKLSHRLKLEGNVEYVWVEMGKVIGGRLKIEIPPAKEGQFFTFLISSRKDFVPRDREEKITPVKNEVHIPEDEPEVALPSGWNAFWIKHPQDSNPTKPTSFYMRKKFTVENKIKMAWVQMTADDGFNLYIQGKKVLEGNAWSKPKSLNITEFLTKGQNIIAVEYMNNAGPGGLLLEATICGEKSSLNIISDATWKCSSNLSSGWTEKGFNDSDWISPQVLGKPPVAPWGNRIPCNYAISLPGDRTNPVAIIEKEDGRPVFKINGKKVFPIILNLGEGRLWLRQIRDFAPAGIHLYCLPAEKRYAWKDEFWLAPGKYDFWRIDEVANILLAKDPEAYFWVDIETAPLPWGWWCKTHQDQLIQFADGTRGSAPDKMGVSYGGELYRKDSREALLNLISHVENSPYADRVVGYFLTGSEWFQRWDAHSNPNYQLIDYSPIAVKKFREYLTTKYKNNTALLRESWHNNSVTFETAMIPPPEKRRKGEIGLLKDPKEAQDSIDYLESWADNLAEDINYFARAVKEKTDYRKTVGAYYGYVYCAAGVQWLYAHLGVKKVLEFPYLDFFFAPQSYVVRKIGDPCEEQPLFSSIMTAGKIPVMDNDTRTHLGGMAEMSLQLFNLEQTLAVIQRDFGYVLVRQYGISWLPLIHWNAFHDPQILESLKTMRKVGQIAYERGNLNNREIAVIVDAESLMYQPLQGNGVHPSPSTTLVYNQMLSLGRIGAPVAQHLFSDILSPNFPDYKLYIFLNCLKYDDEYKDAIDKKIRKEGKVAIWMYAPGFYKDFSASDTNMQGLTGISLKMINKQQSPVVDIINYANPLTVNGIYSGMWGNSKEKISPTFFVNDNSADILGTYRDTKKAAFVIKDIKGWRSIFIGGLELPPDVARNAARLAGVHIYNHAGDVIEANREFLMIHTNFDGRRKIRLLNKSDVVDIFQGEVIARGVKEFELDIPKNKTRIFYLGNAEEFLSKLRSQE